MAPDLAFNSAIHFCTNNNWQSCSGQTAASNFSHPNPALFDKRIILVAPRDAILKLTPPQPDARPRHLCGLCGGGHCHVSVTAVRITDMNGPIRFDVIVPVGRAVAVRGDVDTLLLDKTATITFAYRMASEWIPLRGTPKATLPMASQSGDTPQGLSIIARVKAHFTLTDTDVIDTTIILFAAQTRMSGIDHDAGEIRKSVFDSILRYANIKGRLAARLPWA